MISIRSRLQRLGLVASANPNGQALPDEPWVPPIFTRGAFVLVPLAVGAALLLHHWYVEPPKPLTGGFAHVMIRFSQVAIPGLSVINASPLLKWIYRPVLLLAMILVVVNVGAYIAAQATR